MIDWVQALLTLDDSASAARFDPKLKRILADTVIQFESLYREAAERCVTEFPERLTISPQQFLEQMQDLHHGVLLKTLITIGFCDRHWGTGEKEAARQILQHVWKIKICSESLRPSLEKVVAHATMLKWPDLFRPFLDIPELRDDLPPLLALVIRLANLIAKADGEVLADELIQLEKIRSELSQLRNPPRTKQSASQSQTLQLNSRMIEVVHSVTTMPVGVAVRGTESESKKFRTGQVSSTIPQATEPIPSLTSAQKQAVFEDALKKLESLTGLDSIKNDLRQLVDFLKMQAARDALKLPTTQISLHALFTGNPGTGKTTVARIVGKLLQGLGILNQGQTIEADRSTLVAQYAGQTAPRVHECIDRALDGVLFIDEAYSLVAESGEDAFGNEAIQVLLKRMEDDRDRIVVVLAGYPAPMQRMLRSNPGLTSRFQRILNFPDYTPPELLKIFQSLCREHKYQYSKSTRAKLLAGFEQLVANKDEHFGNGRTVRNLFEQALQRMSSRISTVTPLTVDLLTTLQSADIEFG